MKLPKYWFIKNDYQEVRDYLAAVYKEDDIKEWCDYDYIGWDGGFNYSGCHGLKSKFFHNDAVEITIAQFRDMADPNKEPNYEIY